MVKALEWVDGARPCLRLIDQTLLPAEEKYIDISDVAGVIDAVKRLVVRGAPALGAVGAYGVAIALLQAEREKWTKSELQENITAIRNARPTAVNLAWGVDQVYGAVTQGYDLVLAKARNIEAQDTASNRHLSRLGADWLVEKLGKRKLRVLTHCNTGALATTSWGTAYGVIHELYQRGLIELVYADETRPLLQGSRLTAYELTKDGIPYVIEPDGAAASTITRGLVDFAIIGADRIAANGDSANKIGSLSLGLAAKYAGIPFLVAAPFSTVDLETKSGEEIEIEERSGTELKEFNGMPVSPSCADTYNPAFDVTPHDLITAIITDKGVFEPSKSSEGEIFKKIEN